MTIEAHDYLLDGQVDVPALQEEICDAMRKGGGIVSFASARNRPMTAIISPGVPVLFETVEAGTADEPAGKADVELIEAYLDGY